MFWHEYAKIPRHAGQNAINEGDFKCILTRNCEGAEQLQNGYVAYGRYSYIGKKMPGKIFSRHLFHLCGSKHKTALADT